MLKLLHQRTGLDVGDIQSPVTGGIGSDAGPEPRALLSRVLAHAGHRVPGVKRFEKRLEGTEKRSGVLSDVMALLAQLYRRNEAQVEQVVPALAQVFFDNLKKPPATDATDATESRRPPFVVPEPIPFDPSIPTTEPFTQPQGGTP